MNGMFDSCCDCSAGPPGWFMVSRKVGGFAEYEITHTTTNPITWFIGRRYDKADWSQSYNASQTVTDGGNISYTASGDVYGFSTLGLQVFGFTLVSEYSALLNVPTARASGTVSGGGAATASFASDGYFSEWGGSGNCYDLPSGLTLCGEVGSSPTISGIGISPILYTGSISCPGDEPSGIGFVTTIVGSGYSQFDCSFSPITGGNSASLTGSGISATGSLSPSDWFSSGEIDWTVDFTLEAAYSCSTCNGGAGGAIPFASSITVAFDQVESASSILSSEVNYNGIIDSLTSAISTIQGSFGTPACSVADRCWGFNDYDHASDPSCDGSLNVGYGFQNFTSACSGFLDYYLVNDSCAIPGGTGFEMPCFETVPFSASFFALGDEDSPGAEGADDTWIATFSGQANVTGNYILATYIVMNDFSFILDTFGGPTSAACQDFSASGTVWVPQPSAKSLPASLFTVSGGILSGPIGRIACIIDGTTCDTWDGTQPT